MIWLAILAPLPYTLSRVLRAVGIPVGFSSAGLRELDIPGWGSLTVAWPGAARGGHGDVRARGGSLARLHGSSLGAAGAWQTGSPAAGAIAVLALPIAVLVYALAISPSAPLGLLELPDTSPNQEGWGGAWLTKTMGGAHRAIGRNEQARNGPGRRRGSRRPANTGRAPAPTG